MFAQVADSTKNDKKAGTVDDILDYPSTLYIYGGVGIGANSRFSKLNGYDKQSLPFIVGFEKSGVGFKGFNLPNIISNGLFFGYNKYTYTDDAMGNYSYGTLTIATRATIQLMPILEAAILKEKLRVPLGLYVGGQVGYEYTSLQAESLYYSYLYGYYGLNSRIFAQPFIGAELYLGPLGAYVELGKTTKSLLSAGIRLKFQRK